MPKENLSSQFMIAEFNALQERAKSYEEIKSSRVNFFLLIVAACGALISTIFQSKASWLDQSFLLTIFSLFISAIGLFTLKSLIDYSIAIVIFYRRAGRIRNWFATQDKSISNYLAFAAADDRPFFKVPTKILHWRGAEYILLLINSVTVSLFFTFLIRSLINASVTILVICFIAIGIIIWYLQVFWTKYLMNDAENSKWAQERILYPSAANKVKQVLEN